MQRDNGKNIGGAGNCRDECIRLKQEVADLHSELEQVRIEKEELSNRLLRANFEIEEELDTARRIQNSLLPKKFPSFIDIGFSALYIPTGKVGGDFYDIVVTENQKIALLIYDVSGHGIPAAFIGAVSKMLYERLINSYTSPARIFETLNKELCAYFKTDHYLTAFLGIYDPIQNDMVYSRGGHVKPVLYREKRGEVELLDSKGFFIGHSAFEDIAEYEEKRVVLDPRDKLFLYTDGLTEAMNKAGEQFGLKRLMGIIQGHGEEDVDKLITRVREKQETFLDSSPLVDDFTILCVRIGDSSFLLRESGFSKEEKPEMMIANQIEEIDHISYKILRAMDTAGFSDSEIRRTKICLYEMIINGILHGNCSDKEKKVFIFYKVNSDRLKISVVDEGEGFDYGNLPDPSKGENVTKNHGRGVFIIKKIMDVVEFNEKGNRIMAVKYHGTEKK